MRAGELAASSRSSSSMVSPLEYSRDLESVSHLGITRSRTLPFHQAPHRARPTALPPPPALPLPPHVPRIQVVALVPSHLQDSSPLDLRRNRRRLCRARRRDHLGRGRGRRTMRRRGEEASGMGHWDGQRLRDLLGLLGIGRRDEGLRPSRRHGLEVGRADGGTGTHPYSSGRLGSLGGIIRRRQIASKSS